MINSLDDNNAYTLATIFLLCDPVPVHSLAKPLTLVPVAVHKLMGLRRFSVATTGRTTTKALPLIRATMR